MEYIAALPVFLMLAVVTAGIIFVLGYWTL